MAKAMRICIAACLAATAAVSIFSPVLALAVFPAVLVLGYYLSVRACRWVMIATAAVYLVAACVFGSVFYAAETAVCALLSPLPFVRARIKNSWAEIGICAGIGVLAVTVTVCVWAAATGAGVADCVVNAAKTLDYDFAARALAKLNYSKLGADALGHEPLSVRDELYLAETIEQFALAIGHELDEGVLWYLTGYGAFAAGVGALGALAAMNTDGGAPVTHVPVKELRLSRTYLLAAVVPALVFALFALYEPMRPAVRTVVNLLVTLPTAVCGLTLLYHSLARVPGKPKIAVIVLYWLLVAVAALFYEWGLLIFGFLGLGDCVLNVRRLLDWALSD